MNGTAATGEMSDIKPILIHFNQKRQRQILGNNPVMHHPFDRRGAFTRGFSDIKAKMPTPASLFVQLAHPANTKPLMHNYGLTSKAPEELITQSCGVWSK